MVRTPALAPEPLATGRHGEQVPLLDCLVPEADYRRGAGKLDFNAAYSGVSPWETGRPQPVLAPSRRPRAGASRRKASAALSA